MFSPLCIWYHHIKVKQNQMNLEHTGTSLSKIHCIIKTTVTYKYDKQNHALAAGNSTWKSDKESFHPPALSVMTCEKRSTLPQQTTCEYIHVNSVDVHTVWQTYIHKMYDIIWHSFHGQETRHHDIVQSYRNSIKLSNNHCRPHYI